MTKISYPMKIYFLSFTCDDVKVVLTTSFSANGKLFFFSGKILVCFMYLSNKEKITCLLVDTSF